MGLGWKSAQRRPTDVATVRGTAGADARFSAVPPLLSVVVPTRNETLNVEPLVERAQGLTNTLGAHWEILFVDDSDDGTPAEVQALANAGRAVRLVHREPSERSGGLAGAVLAGFAATDARFLAVMDGDLQHPPEVLARLVQPILDGSADVVVASRYIARGSRDGLDGLGRRLVSSWSTVAVHLLIPRSRAVTDPLGGFFALRREVIEDAELHPDGFKILLEILAQGTWSRVTEVPYEFAPREQGQSKADLRQGLRFGRHLAGLFHRRPRPGVDVRLRSIAGSISLRVALATAAVLVAFWYPLRSLISAWDPVFPSSMVAVVPFAVAFVLAMRARPPAHDPPIHDRQVDYLLGLAALAVSVFMLVALPNRMGAAFWIKRVDLLALPFFLAGVVAILFGIRALWRVRAAFVLVLLFWPIGIQAVGNGVSEPLTRATREAIRSVASVTNLGAFGADGRHFLLSSGSTIDLRSGLGAASMVFLCLIFGLALVTGMSRGLRNALVGLGLVAIAAWLANVLRLVLAIVVGSVWGVDRARPWAGTPGFVVAALVLLVIALSVWVRVGSRNGAVVGVRPWPRVPAVVQPGLAFGIAGSIALSLAFVTTSYIRFEPVADAFGNAKLATLAKSRTPPGFRELAVDRSGRAPSGAATHLAFERASLLPPEQRVRFVVDGLATGDPGIKAGAALRSRYPLHGYELVASRSISLPFGQRGVFTEFRRPGGERWDALSWAWPVRGPDGYERVVVSDRELFTATARVTTKTAPERPLASLSERDLRGLAIGLVRERLRSRADVPSATQSKRAKIGVPRGRAQ